MLHHARPWAEPAHYLFDPLNTLLDSNYIHFLMTNEPPFHPLFISLISLETQTYFCNIWKPVLFCPKGNYYCWARAEPLQAYLSLFSREDWQTFCKESGSKYEACGPCGLSCSYSNLPLAAIDWI